MHAHHYNRSVYLHGARVLRLNSSDLLGRLLAAGNVQVLGSRDLGAGDREDDFNVARVALVGVDATVRAEGPPAGLGRLVDDNVLDDQLLGGEVLGVGVGLGVLEQAGDVVHRLGGPATL